MRAQPAGDRGDGGGSSLIAAQPAGRQVCPGQAEPGRIVIERGRVPSPRVEYPLGHLRAVARQEHQLDLPVAVRTLPGIPLGVIRARAALGQPLSDNLAEPGAGPRVPRAADGCPLRLLGAVRPLGKYRALEAAHSLDRDARHVGDLVRGLSGTDPVLDLLGSQRILHFDLILSEPRELAARNRPGTARTAYLPSSLTATRRSSCIDVPSALPGPRRGVARTSPG